jgi:cytochrome c oxidase cbb3-type subunit 2
MNNGPLLFFGILVTLASSFWGLILGPQLKIGRQEIRMIEATGALYPTPRPGLAQKGAEVYRSLGCAECHTQQVRPRESATDFARGWGQRRTVGQDYLHDYPIFLGSQRIGPDLANIGRRQTNALHHLLHLYDPQLVTPGSMMPRYPFLFEKRKAAARKAGGSEALPLGAKVEPGYEIVPRPEADALVAYLLSLQAETPLFEAPLPLPPTKAEPAQAESTNAVPATPTNEVAAPVPPSAK